MIVSVLTLLDRRVTWLADIDKEVCWFAIACEKGDTSLPPRNIGGTLEY